MSAYEECKRIIDEISQKIQMEENHKNNYDLPPNFESIFGNLFNK